MAARPMRHPRTRARLAALALAAVGAGALASPALAAKDDVVLISRATGPAGAPVDASAFSPAITASGERVAFESVADNLSAEDDNGVTNIFVRDAAANTTVLVTRETGAAGAGADGSSGGPGLSADGRLVVFTSDADNLSAEDNNADDNVFVRDLVASTTTLVSRATGAGGAPADARAHDADISADGRYVAFRSGADNLAPDADDLVNNIFVRDLVANTTTLVSRRAGASGAAANGDAVNPSISGDGNRVAFTSDANNLSNEDDNSVANVFVREIAAATVTLVSRASGAAGAPGSDNSGNPDLSPSGRFVAFESSANNLAPDDRNAFSNVFLRDLDASTTALASRATGPAGAAGDADSADPASSPYVSDNARVTFISLANNLSPDDNDAVTNVFVRDALAGTTELVSRAPGPAGAAANASSSNPAISADGRFVAFDSPADNLVAGTLAGVTNVFRRDTLGDVPRATLLCKVLPLPPAPPDKDDVTFTLSVQQLRINQRISQAAIRRLNAVEARLNGGLSTRDLCGYSVGPAELGTGHHQRHRRRSRSRRPSPADPAAIVDPGRSGPGDPLTLSGRQLLINQRIDQAAIRRATGIGNRLDSGLTGGDVRAGQVTQGKLYDRLAILSRVAGARAAGQHYDHPAPAQPARSRQRHADVTQLRINQRIAQAGVRNANALIRRLETGLSGADLRPGTLTAADLG